MGSLCCRALGRPPPSSDDPSDDLTRLRGVAGRPQPRGSAVVPSFLLNLRCCLTHNVPSTPYTHKYNKELHVICKRHSFQQTRKKQRAVVTIVTAESRVSSDSFLRGLGVHLRPRHRVISGLMTGGEGQGRGAGGAASGREAESVRC